MDTKSMSRDAKFRIHAFYWLGILLFVVIGLLSVQLGDNKDLVQYITFATTLTSLALAVIAIVYVFYSNFSLMHTIGSIQSVAQEASAASAELGQATNALREQVGVSHQR